MDRGTPSRLELNRLLHHWRGGPLLCYSDLDERDMKFLHREFRNHMKPGMDPDAVLASVLSEWCVMCPHPVTKRVYSKERKWYRCGVCDTYGATGETKMAKQLAHGAT